MIEKLGKQDVKVLERPDLVRDTGLALQGLVVWEYPPTGERWTTPDSPRPRASAHLAILRRETTVADDGKNESVCAHCGVPVMRLTIAVTGESFWTHVPSEGPVYLDIACRLVATPLPDESPCDAEKHSWDFFSPNAVDSYWMRCHLVGPHDEHENSETGAKWRDETSSNTRSEESS